MTAEALEPAEPARHKAGPGFWISAAAGWVVILYGLRGIFAHSLDTRPANLAKFVVGGALIHDLIVAPLVVVIAGLTVAKVRGRSRAALTVALVLTATVALFSYPLVRAYGLAAHNPTSLPHNYALNLMIVLGLVWSVTAAMLLFGRREKGKSIHTVSQGRIGGNP